MRKKRRRKLKRGSDMPKTIFIPDGADRSGIDITFTKSTGELLIGGWYDGCVGIPSTIMSLREFLDALGITDAHCRKAFGKGEVG